MSGAQSDLFTSFQQPDNQACARPWSHDACRGGCMASKFFVGWMTDPDPRCPRWRTRSTSCCSRRCGHTVLLLRPAADHSRPGAGEPVPVALRRHRWAGGPLPDPERTGSGDPRPLALGRIAPETYSDPAWSREAEFVRSTRRFDVDSVPGGLLSAHRIAPGVWGELRVFEGEVTFVLEETGATRQLHAGERQVIEPDTSHHVEPAPGAEFAVSFHRVRDGSEPNPPQSG